MTDKFCLNCKHCRVFTDFYGFEQCKATKELVSPAHIDPVNGMAIDDYFVYTLCSEERGPKGECGPDAILFEEKTYEDTWWYQFKKRWFS